MTVYLTLNPVHTCIYTNMVESTPTESYVASHILHALHNRKEYRPTDQQTNNTKQHPETNNILQMPFAFR